MVAGEMPPWLDGDPELGSGGAGWTLEEAERACLGEAVERWLARALPGDGSVEAAWAAWPLEQPAVDPERWALYHAEQHAAPGFPLEPLKRETRCRWACCREAGTGLPVWVPEELVYLLPRPGDRQRHVHGFSTGLSCGPSAEHALLRGLQEVIERDALVGGWWGTYRVEEWPVAVVSGLIGPTDWARVDRPNLRYRFYLIRTPFAGHVTMASVDGPDLEGRVFSVGSACRETRRESWRKSVLEAVQGRHCVRRLLAGKPTAKATPTTFLEHALHYSLNPTALSATVLEQAGPCTPDDAGTEGLAELRAHLGRPVLFRDLTPPGPPGWPVLRVLVPGLQPLHGDHRLPFLGGAAWGRRPVSEWATIPPHPFA